MSNEALSTLNHISSLVQSTLDQIDEARVPTSAIARRALRIARLRNDWEGQWWLQLEMTTPAIGNGVNKDLLMTEARRISGEVAAHLTAEEFHAVGERVARRWLGGRATDKGFQVQSIANLEELVTGIEEQIGSLATVPPGMHPVDLYHRHQQLIDATAQLRVGATEAKQLLARVRTQIGDYLSVTEQQLLFGQVNADVFERNRKWVDERLAADAPAVLEQFAAAYRRQADGDVESRSHALTSCRRVLKTLADLLYPADGALVEGIDGRNRKMTDDKFISRLVQFATRKATASAPRDVLIAQIKALGERLDALNDLSSKGVHAQVSGAEVDQCLIQTYLAVGDLLRLADADSGALAA